MDWGGKNGTILIVGGIYRHPGGDVKKFGDIMDEKMKAINKEKKLNIIVGDMNIDLGKFNQNKNTAEHLENIIFNGYIPLIIIPSRITPKSATIIDHIYLNNNSKLKIDKIISGNIYEDMTDHLPNFCNNY